jgi:hypothetical protein
MDRRQSSQLALEASESVPFVLLTFLGEGNTFLQRPAEERLGKTTKVELQGRSDGGWFFVRREVERGLVDLDLVLDLVKQVDRN